MNSAFPSPIGLYHPSYEHDACGVGMVADTRGRSSHDIVLNRLTVLERLFLPAVPRKWVTEQEY